MSEVFARGQRVRATQAISYGDGYEVEVGHLGTVKVAGHDPETHIAYLDWDGDDSPHRWASLRELEAE